MVGNFGDTEPYEFLCPHFHSIILVNWGVPSYTSWGWPGKWQFLFASLQVKHSLCGSLFPIISYASVQALEAATPMNQFAWISVQVSSLWGWISTRAGQPRECNSRGLWDPVMGTVGPSGSRSEATHHFKFAGNVAPRSFPKEYAHTHTHPRRKDRWLLTCHVGLGHFIRSPRRGFSPIYEQKPTNHCFCEIFALAGSGARLPNFLLLLLYCSIMVPLQSFYYNYFYSISFCF